MAVKQDVASSGRNRYDQFHIYNVQLELDESFIVVNDIATLAAITVGIVVLEIQFDHSYCAGQWLATLVILLEAVLDIVQTVACEV